MTANPLFQRLALLIGPEAAALLERSRVIVVGLGGVGSWCAEALARSGIGGISLVDFDRVCASNVNRQVQAVSSTIGSLKAEALEARLKDINPLCGVKVFPLAFSKETAGVFDLAGADCVIDAIDTLSCKLDLIEAAAAAGTNFFSSMGMARKLDPALIKTADIWKTSGCPLARLVREGLRKRNFSGHFTAVYSSERIPQMGPDGDSGGADSADGGLRAGLSASAPEPAAPELAAPQKRINGSAVTVTAVAGMILASLAIRELCAPCAPPSPPMSPAAGG